MNVSVVLERCADCRRICLCRGECVCMVIDAHTTDIVCHACMDAREA